LRRLRQIGYLLLPRPAGLLHKAEFFWLGFFIALPFANQPVLTSIRTALWYFFILEILLQQAKFQWNDLRDKKVDKQITRNQNRLYVPFSDNMVAVLYRVRWFSALLLGIFTSRPFFVALLVITLHQILYEYVVKPQSKRFPVGFLVFLAFNLPLRVVCGFLVILEPSILLSQNIFAINLLLFYMMSWSSLANSYFTEAHEAVGDKFYTRFDYKRPIRWFSWQGFLAIWHGVFDSQERYPFTRPYSQFFYEDGKRIAALMLYPSILVVISFAIQYSNYYTRICNGLIVVMFVLCTMVAPFTWRDVGLGKYKYWWRRWMPPLIYTTSVVVFTICIALIIQNPQPIYSAWYILVYTIYHYLRYIEDPLLHIKEDM
jgi:hypothetical protein